MFNGRYCITKFDPTHNHEVVTPKVFMLKSHRKVTTTQAATIEQVEKSGIRPKAGYEMMDNEVGEHKNLGFLPED